MSIECLNQALKITGLTPTKKFILVLLANYADEKGACYPSYKHIAKTIGLKTHKGVQKTIKEFEQLGYLKIEHRFLENKSYTSNKYHLTLGRVIKDPSVLTETSVGPTETFNTKDKTKTNIYGDNFETFWKLYPRKVGKYKAAMSFEKALQFIFFDELIKATKIFIKEHERTEEQFIPHAATWLNQKRYLDYKDKEYKPNNLNNLAG